MPHEGIDLDRPANRYAAAVNRPYPKRKPKPEYASNIEKRKVSENGWIKWSGEAIFISSALANQTVGIEAKAEGFLDVLYFSFRVGSIDEQTLKFH